MIRSIQIIFIISLFYSQLVVDCTRILALITIKCTRYNDDTAKVFLMEKDASDTWLENIDEDDTLDKGKYRFNRTPEERLELIGTDYELFGLEPYLAIWHSCSSSGNDWRLKKVPLGDTIYQDKKYKVTIDLDTDRYSVGEFEKIILY